MKFYHRLSFFVLTLLFLFLVFLLGVYAFGWLPANYLPLLLASTYNSLEVGFISVILFLLGIWLLQSFITDSKSNETIVQDNEIGEICISLSAIQDLVEQLILDQPGIKNVKSKFDLKGEIFNIFLKLTVTTEADIPSLSSKLESLVRSYLRDTVGIQVNDVSVMVDEVETIKKRSTSTVRVR